MTKRIDDLERQKLFWTQNQEKDVDSVGLDVAINGDIFDLFIKNAFTMKNNQ